MYTLCKHCITLWHYTTPRDVGCFLPQQTGSQMLTRYDEFYLRHVLHYESHQEIVKCLSSSTVPVLEISAMGMSRCLIARCCGFRLLMSGRRNHRCFSSHAPEKEPTTKQQIGKWLVGGCGSLAIVTFGWDMWRHRQEQERHRQEQERHRQEQERVKNIILRASFRAREPPVKIERKTIKATCATFIFVVFASAFLERRDLFLR